MKPKRRVWLALLSALGAMTCGHQMPSSFPLSDWVDLSSSSKVAIVGRVLDPHIWVWRPEKMGTRIEARADGTRVQTQPSDEALEGQLVRVTVQKILMNRTERVLAEASVIDIYAGRHSRPLVGKGNEYVLFLDYPFTLSAEIDPAPDAWRRLYGTVVRPHGAPKYVPFDPADAFGFVYLPLDSRATSIARLPEYSNALPHIASAIEMSNVRQYLPRPIGALR